GAGPRGEARRAGHHSALVLRLTALVEDRETDPREAGLEAGAPDDVRDLDHTSVLEQGTTTFHTAHACDARDAGALEVVGLLADERRALADGPDARAPSQPCRHREQAVEHESEQRRRDDA